MANMTYNRANVDIASGTVMNMDDTEERKRFLGSSDQLYALGLFILPKLADEDMS